MSPGFGATRLPCSRNTIWISTETEFIGIVISGNHHSLLIPAAGKSFSETLVGHHSPATCCCPAAPRRWPQWTSCRPMRANRPCIECAWMRWCTDRAEFQLVGWCQRYIVPAHLANMGCLSGTCGHLLETQQLARLVDELPCNAYLRKHGRSMRLAWQVGIVHASGRMASYPGVALSPGLQVSKGGCCPVSMHTSHMYPTTARPF
jgi:hypothetical protein